MNQRSRCELKTQKDRLKQYELAFQHLSDEIKSSGLSKPALRALVDHNIYTIDALRVVDMSTYSRWHGIGPKTIRQIANLL